MPRELRAIAGFTAEYARAFAPDRLEPLVGGFIMLRIFNPALVAPEGVGLLPKGTVMSPTARRNLTLITKMLQNVANGVLFGAKEEYMIPLNSFVEDNKETMRQFLVKLAADPEGKGWSAFVDPPTQFFRASDIDVRRARAPSKLPSASAGELVSTLSPSSRFPFAILCTDCHTYRRKTSHSCTAWRTSTRAICSRSSRS